MRRAIPYIAALIVLLGLGIAVYLFFVNRDAGITAEPGITNPFKSIGEEIPGQGGTMGGTGEEDGDVWNVDESGEWVSNEIAPRLVKIADGPVAVGAVALDLPDMASTTLEADPTTKSLLTNIEVRYVARTSGNIFSYLGEDGKSTRLSNRTVPGIQDAHWLPDGSMAYLRSLVADADGTEHIGTYAVSADGATGTALPNYLVSIDTAPGRLFTLSETTGGTTASVSAPDGTGAATVFNSPIAGLRAELLGNSYLAVTKPSAKISGYAFSVSPGGVFTRILGPLAGLSAHADAEGAQVLMSYLDGKDIRLGLLKVSDQSYMPLPLQTFADKCAFSPDGLLAYCAVPTLLPYGAVLPDAWYQGTVAFTDRLWRIDFAARVTTMAADLPELTDEPIDAVSLTLNPKGTALVFTNRRDNSLWIYAL